MRDIGTQKTLESAAVAKKSLVGLEEKYYLPERPTEPNVFITLTDNWIMLRLRYVIEVRERLVVHSRLSDLILRKNRSNSFHHGRVINHLPRPCSCHHSDRQQAETIRQFVTSVTTAVSIDTNQASVHSLIN